MLGSIGFKGPIELIDLKFLRSKFFKFCLTLSPFENSISSSIFGDGHPMKTMMEMTAGTPTTESTTIMALPVTIVLETTAATSAAVKTMVTSARFLQSSATSSQAPTGGRLVSMYQADRLALGAIVPSLVMTPSFFYE
jgi:hypothetical protein